MKKVILAIVLTFVVTLALVWLALVVVARTGAVNVAATSDSVAGVDRFFDTLADESIRRHAAAAVEAGELQPAGDPTDAMLRTGAEHFHSMCVPCHGSPGGERGEYGKGLHPEPPEPSHIAEEMSEAEILWVLKHGIRHTGMPAFGATHSEQELQAIAAFASRLDRMSPDEYRRLTAGAGPSPGHGHDPEHAHGDGDGEAAEPPAEPGHEGHEHGGERENV